MKTTRQIARETAQAAFEELKAQKLARIETLKEQLRALEQRTREASAPFKAQARAAEQPFDEEHQSLKQQIASVRAEIEQEERTFVDNMPMSYGEIAGIGAAVVVVVGCVGGIGFAIYQGIANAPPR